MIRTVLLLSWAFVISMPGCSGGGPENTAAPENAAAAPSSAERGARTLPIPGAAESAPGPAHASAARLTWTVPQGWVGESPASPMRRAQYRVSGPGGDASCLVFYFGPGQGGDLMGNARRWAGQFSQPDGRPSAEVMTVTALDSAPFPSQVVELTGTYEGGMTGSDEPAPRQPGYMLLGAVVEGPDAPWFFKFTGPTATVSEQREAFLDLIASIRADG